MKFEELELAGAFLIGFEPIEDERGYFARTYCREEFAAHGLTPQIAQTNVSYNRRAGTLRGMHMQVAPHAEAKLVRCTRGAIWDVIVDLREGSPTRRRWVAVTLTGDDERALYVPEGFLHGFLTLEDDTTVQYQMSTGYHPECARGFAWNDPALAIAWPAEPRVISATDAAHPTLEP